jgi:His/Glu/Gln/Arg/opine family amino acid ABC transporter permease subunit
VQAHMRRVALALIAILVGAVFLPAIAGASLAPEANLSVDTQTTKLTAAVSIVTLVLEPGSTDLTRVELDFPQELRPDQVKGRNVLVSTEGADVTMVEDVIEIDFLEGLGSDDPIEITIEGLTTPESPGDYDLSGTAFYGSLETMLPDAAVIIPKPNIGQRLVLWIEDQPFLHLFFSPVIIAEALPVLVKGFQVAVLILFFGYIIAMPGGLALSFMKMAKSRWVRWPSTFYIDLVRGTPLLVQILLVYFGITFLPFYKNLIDGLGPLASWSLYKVDATQYYRIIIALALNSSAYMAEIFRAGIQSIHKGQLEAARSLGMSVPQSMAYVVIPQTVRRILPTMMSEFILLFKDTSLAFSVGVFELTLQARTVQARTFNMSPYIAAAGFYLLLTLPLGRFVASLEERLSIAETGRGPEKKVKKPGSGFWSRKFAKESA